MYAALFDADLDAVTDGLDLLVPQHKSRAGVVGMRRRVRLTWLMERAGRSYTYIALVSVAVGLLTLVGTGLFGVITADGFEPAWFWVAAATVGTALAIFVIGARRSAER